MRDEVGLIFGGGVLVVIGVFSILQKRFTLPFGRIGFWKPKPIFIFVLTEARAVQFGYISLISGLIMVGIGVQVYITHNEKAIMDGVLIITTIIGISTTIFVFIFELFMELLANLRDKAMNKEGKNGTHSDSTNN